MLALRRKIRGETFKNSGSADDEQRRPARLPARRAARLRLARGVPDAIKPRALEGNWRGTGPAPMLSATASPAVPPGPIRPMRHPHVALAALLALQAACAPAPRHDTASVPPVQDPCRIPSWAALVMADADLGLAPGESAVLRPPVIREGPRGPQSLPAGCAVGWGVAGTGAEIDSAGRLSISPAARPGDSLYVVARAMGATARARVTIVATGSNPVAGMWRQVETPECVSYYGLIGELVLRPSGVMLLTFKPFETYVDIAGTYTFDPATTRLVLKSSTREMDDGVFLEGRARVEGDSLEVHLAQAGDMSGLFYFPPGDEGCRARFQRVTPSR